MIQRGQLEAERVHRPQGSIYLVTLPHEGTEEAPVIEHPAQNMFRTQETARAPEAAADAMVSLIQTTIGTILGPLVGQLDAQRQTIDRQAERVAELERENGRFAAERAAAEARYVALEARTAAQTVEPTPEPSTPHWRALMPWLLAVLAIVAAVGLAA